MPNYYISVTVERYGALGNKIDARAKRYHVAALNWEEAQKKTHRLILNDFENLNWCHLNTRFESYTCIL